MVGMDKYFLSSEMAFYDPDKDGSENTGGRSSSFGLDSLKVLRSTILLFLSERG
jgi:hypothetical protein